MLNQDKILKDSYRIIEKIGAGGGGIVYKAYHERLHTYVVVKKIKESVIGHIDTRGEADILKNIKHTYLPRVYDFLELDGEVYTVMDYIPGESFSQILNSNKKLPQKLVLKWANQLCEALSYLHSQNPPIIHSDIKPSNIMLNPEGDICLIDFNISLVFDKNSSDSLGISGGYSPPEQHRDKKSYHSYTGIEAQSHTPDAATALTEALKDEELEVTETLAKGGSKVNLKADIDNAADQYIGRGITERSDVYGLGATLYHMITGIRPSLDYEKIIPISQSGVEISQGFAYIIEKAMKLDPEQRYRNAGDMLRDLKDIVKLDKRYKQYVNKKRSTVVALTLLYIVSFSTISFGAYEFYKELDSKYYNAVKQADNLIMVSDFNAAQVKIDEALGLFDKRIDAYYEEAFLYFNTGNYDRCIEYCTDAINNPQYSMKTEYDEKKKADIWFLAGNSYYENEDYINANNCFENAIKINQDNSEYYRDYAISLVKSGDIDEAKEKLDEAVSLGLERDSIHMVEGEISYGEGDFSAAVDQLKKAIDTAQNQNLKMKAYKLCAQAYKSMGDSYLTKEIALLEEATSNNVIKLSLLEMLGDAYAREAKKTGDSSYFSKALDCFQQLLDSGYSNYQTLENIAVIQQQLNQLNDAENTLKKMMEDYPKEYRVYKRLAFLEADMQQVKPNDERDYHKMDEYYKKASRLYQDASKNGNTDSEMMMLDNMMNEIKNGGWL